MASANAKNKKSVGRPKGEEMSRIMIYLPVAMADTVRSLVSEEGMSLTSFYERLTREELARRGRKV